MRTTPDTTDARHAGPPSPLVAVFHGALFFASLVLPNGAADGSMPVPGSPDHGIRRFVGANAGLLRVVGMLQFGAAVPLALFAATAASRLRPLGVRAAGATIALAGGLMAATLMAVTGLLMVTAGAVGGRADAAVAVVLHEPTFSSAAPATSPFSGCCSPESPSPACSPVSCPDPSASRR